MYQELGSIKEIVALSPRETLDSAAALLVQLGYEITKREDTSVTAIRRKREGMLGHSLQNLTVAALPQSEGGVKVELRGTDREGVQERQDEWTTWADSLPKLGQEHEQEQVAPGAAEPQTAKTRAEEPVGESRESSGTRSGLSEGEVSEHAHKPEMQEAANGGEDEPTRPAEPGRWTTVASWDREQRVAPGKQEAEPSPTQESPSSGGTKFSVDDDEGRDDVANDPSIPKVVEAESFRLVNNRGEPRGVLGLTDDSPYLELKGTGGDNRVLFRVAPEHDSPQLAMLDGNGEIRLYVGLQSDGSPNISLADGDGNIRAILNVGMQASSDGVTPSLTFLDSSGEHRFKVLNYEGDEPRLLFMNEQGNTSIILSEQEGRPAFTLLDESGTTRGVIQLGPDDSSGLIVQSAGSETVPKTAVEGVPAPRTNVEPSAPATDGPAKRGYTVGDTAVLSAGDRLTLHSYKSPVPPPGHKKRKAGYEFSILDVEVCASANSGRLEYISAFDFFFQMPDNTRLKPEEQHAERELGFISLLPEDPVRGLVFFHTPEGEKPRFVIFTQGFGDVEVIKWAL